MTTLDDVLALLRQRMTEAARRAFFAIGEDRELWRARAIELKECEAAVKAMKEGDK